MDIFTLTEAWLDFFGGDFQVFQIVCFRFHVGFEILKQLCECSFGQPSHDIFLLVEIKRGFSVAEMA